MGKRSATHQCRVPGWMGSASLTILRLSRPASTARLRHRQFAELPGHHEVTEIHRQSSAMPLSNSACRPRSRAAGCRLRDRRTRHGRARSAVLPMPATCPLPAATNLRSPPRCPGRRPGRCRRKRQRQELLADDRGFQDGRRMRHREQRARRQRLGGVGGGGVMCGAAAARLVQAGIAGDIAVTDWSVVSRMRNRIFSPSLLSHVV